MLIDQSPSVFTQIVQCESIRLDIRVGQCNVVELVTDMPYINFMEKNIENVKNIIFVIISR